MTKLYLTTDTCTSDISSITRSLFIFFRRRMRWDQSAVRLIGYNWFGLLIISMLLSKLRDSRLDLRGHTARRTALIKVLDQELMMNLWKRSADHEHHTPHWARRLGTATPPVQAQMKSVAGGSAGVQIHSLARKKGGRRNRPIWTIEMQSWQTGCLANRAPQSGGLNVKESLCQCKYRLPSVSTPFVSHRICCRYVRSNYRAISVCQGAGYPTQSCQKVQVLWISNECE